ncbi:MAG TPA: beta-phosphoglucomutase family hydrolase [Solirubrobacteraceae bacterium]|nr:beta-phosphoglucomutase family hydrolase [Solirubrobacteraceae bacterium]
MLGLPDGVTVCLFDLDGVLTKTAKVHAAAWKEMFDAYLAERAKKSGGTFEPFDEVQDYDRYVDGKPRYDGVRSFLQSRDIRLPEGSEDDAPGLGSIHAVGNLKNELVLALIERDGVAAYGGSMRYLDAVREAGLARAVVSSSANCRAVLKSAGIAGYFDTVVDGVVAEREGLAGKPAPDTFLKAAEVLGVPAAGAAVFEDALAGVQAGHDGHFGYVVGVDRAGQARELREHGADRVVADLADLLVEA